MELKEKLQAGIVYAKAHGIAIDFTKASDRTEGHGSLGSCAYWAAGGEERWPLLLEIATKLEVEPWPLTCVEFGYIDTQGLYADPDGFHLIGRELRASCEP